MNLSTIALISQFQSWKNIEVKFKNKNACFLKYLYIFISMRLVIKDVLIYSTYTYCICILCIVYTYIYSAYTYNRFHLNYSHLSYLILKNKYSLYYIFYIL